MGFHRWVPAERCTDGPQPGVTAFTRFAVEVFGPKGASSWGIYNCRSVRGGSTTSLHGEGRAVDIAFPVGDPDGNRFLRFLLRHPGKLGIQCIIYERRIYSAKSPEGRYYGGVAPHYDHLHIEFSWEAARRLSYTTCIRVWRAEVRKRRRKPGSRNLKVGCKGADVRWLQRKLNIEADGVFGNETRRRVRRFERNHPKRFQRVNGHVNRNTWRVLGVKPSY